MQATLDGRLPGTVVRPSLTYGATHVPLVLNSWHRPYTIVDRFRSGLPVVVPGDGNSLWTVTHSSDFAKGLIGLLGNSASIGEAFHITSDEVLTWNQLFLATAAAAGVRDPKLVHIASDFIVACMPGELGGLMGDKSVSVVFDNSKIKSFVPDFKATVPYAEGIVRSIESMDADPSLRSIDPDRNREIDQLVAVYNAGLQKAVELFSL